LFSTLKFSGQWGGVPNTSIILFNCSISVFPERDTRTLCVITHHLHTHFVFLSLFTRKKWITQKQFSHNDTQCPVCYVLCILCIGYVNSITLSKENALCLFPFWKVPQIDSLRIIEIVKQ
jgi:hypothetical protein